MRVAVLPFNAAEGTKPAFGRQFAAFVAEQLRASADADIQSVSFLTQIEDEGGEQRTAYVNISDQLLPYEQLKELFDQGEVALIQDGFVTQKEDGGFTLTVRYHGKESEEPIRQDELDFPKEDIFKTLHHLVKGLAESASLELPEALAGETMEFGTENADVFLNFLEGYDALTYIQQANGAVTRDFNPEPSFEALWSAVEADEEFEGPYHVLVQLARQCAAFQIGTFEGIETVLKKVIAKFPEEFHGYFALGELHQAVGALGPATDNFEKAVTLEPNDPALYARLGIAQLQQGMPVNAERNFRKAMELEGPDKPSADLLANVLAQTNRAHEVPPMWKAQIEANPQDAQAHTKYALALIDNENLEGAERAFDHAMEVLEDNTLVKRYYAPFLVRKEDYDRAMDFYEDVLDVAPNDIPVLMEYAQTLELADRAFEVPDVLKRVLASNPDPNVRGQAVARLIELEQPKRVENVQAAEKKMQEGDFAGSLQLLRPLKNWLGDYWKLWLLIAVSANRTEQHGEAEEAARRTLEIFPGAEPAYIEYANALGAQDRHDEAYNVMRYAAQNIPNSPMVAVNLALTAKRAGNEDEARGIAKQLREAFGPNPELDPILDEIERR